MYSVTNVSNAPRVVYDRRGRMRAIDPGKTMNIALDDSVAATLRSRGGSLRILDVGEVPGPAPVDEESVGEETASEETASEETASEETDDNNPGLVNIPEGWRDLPWLGDGGLQDLAREIDPELPKVGLKKDSDDPDNPGAVQVIEAELERRRAQS